MIAVFAAMPAAAGSLATRQDGDLADPVLAARARLGEALVNERGAAFAASLAARTTADADVAGDFRAGRMVSINGFWFSASEAVRFLAAAGFVTAR